MPTTTKRVSNVCHIRLFAWAIAVLGSAMLSPLHAADKPNIVLIYSDDVGFGDVSCNGQTTLATPQIDRLASEGLRFTDAHCSAATCTPSRYALLTGNYAFRQKNTGIKTGNANLIIQPGSCTLPSQLKSAGYRTGVVGKWHLGLGDGPIDWNSDVRPGPNEVGFDYHFLVPATGDRVPCVYLEQGKVVGLLDSEPIKVSYGKPVGDEPTGRQHPELLKQKLTHGHDGTIVNGVSRIGTMQGGHAARWVDEEMADVLTGKAKQFMSEEPGKPFFLFFSTHDIHVPRMPHPRFVGSTGLGPRGDAMAQLDWCVGQIIDAIEKSGNRKNTLIIFTSDNGPVLDDGYQDQANEMLGEHSPAGPYRAGKYSMFEGGTRVPMLVSWPGKIASGEVSPALFGQVDLLASLSALTGTALPSDVLLDSQDELDTLLGNDAVGRPHLVHEAWSLALRMGHWKYLSKGRSTRDKLGPWKNFSLKKAGKLYNLESDPNEQHDVAAQFPEQVETMQALLDKIVKQK